MNIKTLKEITGLKNKDIANFFNLSLNSYESSSAKKKYENALVSFFEFTKKRETPGEEPGKEPREKIVLVACGWCGGYGRKEKKICGFCNNIKIWKE